MEDRRAEIEKMLSGLTEPEKLMLLGVLKMMAEPRNGRNGG